MATCSQCGDSLPPGRKGKTCSNACRQRAYRERQKAQEKPEGSPNAILLPQCSAKELQDYLTHLVEELALVRQEFNRRGIPSPDHAVGEAEEETGTCPVCGTRLGTYACFYCRGRGDGCLHCEGQGTFQACPYEPHEEGQVEALKRRGIIRLRDVVG